MYVCMCVFALGSCLRSYGWQRISLFASVWCCKTISSSARGWRKPEGTDSQHRFWYSSSIHAANLSNSTEPVLFYFLNKASDALHYEKQREAVWLRGSASCLILAENVAAVARGGAAAVFQCRAPRPSAVARRGSGPTRSHKWPLQRQTSRQQRSCAACWQWRTRTTAICGRVRKLLIACRFCRPTITLWRKLLHQFIMWWHFSTQIAMEKHEIGSVVWNSSCHIFMSAFVYFYLDTRV